MIERCDDWRKSSYSQGETSCVEVGRSSREVGVRDTQNRGLGHLSFPCAEWAALLREVKADRS